MIFSHKYLITLAFFPFNIFLGYVYLSPILTLYTPPHWYGKVTPNLSLTSCNIYMCALGVQCPASPISRLRRERVWLFPGVLYNLLPRISHTTDHTITHISTCISLLRITMAEQLSYSQRSPKQQLWYNRYNLLPKTSHNTNHVIISRFSQVLNATVSK